MPRCSTAPSLKWRRGFPTRSFFGEIWEERTSPHREATRSPRSPVHAQEWVQYPATSISERRVRSGREGAAADRTPRRGASRPRSHEADSESRARRKRRLGRRERVQSDSPAVGAGDARCLGAHVSCFPLRKDDDEAGRARDPGMDAPKLSRCPLPWRHLTPSSLPRSRLRFPLALSATSWTWRARAFWERRRRGRTTCSVYCRSSAKKGFSPLSRKCGPSSASPCPSDTRHPASSSPWVAEWTPSSPAIV